MTDRLSPAADAGRGGPDAVRHAPALRRPFAAGGKALRFVTALRVDLLGLVGLVLLFVIWQLLTNVLPRYSLPTPFGVAGRIWDDFILAQYLSAYGLPKTGVNGGAKRDHVGVVKRDHRRLRACPRSPWEGPARDAACPSTG